MSPGWAAVPWGLFGDTLIVCDGDCKLWESPRHISHSGSLHVGGVWWLPCLAPSLSATPPTHIHGWPSCF